MYYAQDKEIPQEQLEKMATPRLLRIYKSVRGAVIGLVHGGGDTDGDGWCWTDANEQEYQDNIKKAEAYQARIKSLLGKREHVKATKRTMKRT